MINISCSSFSSSWAVMSYVRWVVQRRVTQNVTADKRASSLDVATNTTRTYDSSNNEPRPAVLLRKPQQLALAPAQSAIFIQKTCIPWWWRLLLLLLLLLFLLAFSHSSIGHFRASSWASARLRRLARAPNYYRSLENNKWTMATMIFLFLSFFCLMH